MPPMSKAANSEGSLRWNPKTHKYEGRVSVPGTQGEKRRQVSAKTKKECREKMRALMASMGLGAPTDVATLKVAKHLDNWLASVKADVAPSTYRKYQQIVNLHLKPIIGHALVKNLKLGDVEHLKNQLMAKKVRGKNLQPGTINQILATFSVVLNRAVKWEYLPKNPARGVGKLKNPDSGLACLSELEAGRLIEVARGTGREALYQVALKCGLREGELLALKWEDLDGDELTVRHSVDSYPKVPVWGTTKTGAQRVITLPPSLVEDLRRHAAFQKALKMARRNEWKDEGLVFPDEVGRVRRGYTLLYRFRKDLEAAGLPRIRIHDLRDSCATLLLSHGTPLHVVAKILGHTDPAITLRRYAHVLADAREAAASRMEGFNF